MVVYEDAPARDLAIDLCDRLVANFNRDLDFEFTWWRFKYFSDPEIAAQALEAATSADLIIVLAHRVEDFTADVQAWFEAWPSKRDKSEGVLVLVQTPADLRNPLNLHHSYLRLVAHRARLDYLSILSPNPAFEPRHNSQANEGVASPAIFDMVSTQQHHYSGWGINE